MNILKHGVKRQLKGKHEHGLGFRHFSNQDSPVQPSFTGIVVYANLFGFTKFTFKTDIISLFPSSHLTPDDIKVVHDRTFFPRRMMLRFPSPAEYDAAVKVTAKTARLLRLEMADPSAWGHIETYIRGKLPGSQLDTTYDGKTVLLQGIPQTAQVEDVERFLSGCSYDSSATMLFQRGDEKAALIRFHSKTETMNALIMKNHNFCLNGQISMRLLQ
ncbi:hypothetical protein M5689_015912 [Euphorbia peplus]|nr:hypothetical protein M5689_015912 [Euphorbia peplus]